MSWNVTVVGRDADGNALAKLASYVAPGRTARCVGSIALARPGSCSSSAVGVNAGASSALPAADVWAVVPVAGKPGVVTLVAASRKAGCARVLAAPSACSTTQLTLSPVDDGSGRQQWKVLGGPQPGPSPAASPAAAPSPAPSPTPIPTPTPTVIMKPSAPTSVTAAAGVATDSCLTLAWTTPASDGGSPITEFNAYCTSAGALAVPPQIFPGTTTSTGQCGFRGVLPGVPYTCTVVAVNAAGAGPASAASNQVVNDGGDGGAGVKTGFKWLETTLSDYTVQTFTPAIQAEFIAALIDGSGLSPKPYVDPFIVLAADAPTPTQVPGGRRKLAAVGVKVFSRINVLVDQVSATTTYLAEVVTNPVAVFPPSQFGTVSATAPSATPSPPSPPPPACTSCPTGKYEVSGCTTSANRVCAPCASSCTSATYEATACTATTNRVCKSCPSDCATCTDGSTCQTCSAGYSLSGSACECSSGTYNNAGTCTTCAAACTGATYEATACTATTNRVCTSCPSECATCTDGSTCQTCLSGFMRMGPDCI